jgi:TldD protein
MRAMLKDALQRAGGDGFVELRWHDKTFRSISVEKGRLERSGVRRRGGVGVRVLVDGTWGFASTGEATVAAVVQAIARARAAAKASAGLRRERIGALPEVELATGDFVGLGVDEVLAMSLEERVALAMRIEAEARAASSSVRSASGSYEEILEEKAIVTSDGADVSFKLVRPQLRVAAVAERDGQLSQVAESIGVTGGWDCLFRTEPGVLADRAARLAVDLLDAKPPEGGRSTVIMAPSIVGLMVHEAIGHTVEADFVQSGSVARGKIGQQVASELVTLCDSGRSEYATGAGGTLPVDDEGVVAGRTAIIEDGKLVSYLHNRESAAAMGVAPTGNARAWEYADQPLIRMRNTYIEPGETTLEEMIASTDDGYLLEGPRNGQADATAEFMFGVTTARRIRGGKLGELVKGVTVTGNAFEVLRSVDAVSSEFKWDLGSGHCGKGQPAKVDAGGPYIRCRAILGGEQS